MIPDIIFYINRDIANGEEWLKEGIKKGVFRDIPINQTPNPDRLRNCKTAGFYLTREISINNNTLGVGVSIIGEIINYDPPEVKLSNILEIPLTRDDLSINWMGNRDFRYLI
ncbi:MAG: hypothetical protein KAT66_10440 [Candidatus Lokiarchaeota archaeon]|nr:hypothetical protein [Candidatus Lokiarchaeota archaeon]